MSDLVSSLDWSTIPDHIVEVLLIVFMVFVFYGLLSAHWFLACKLIDPATEKRQMLSFFASQPYKYLPTSIFTFSSRAKFSSQLGMSLKKSSAAQLVENFDLIGSAIGIGALALLFQRSQVAFWGALTLLVALSGALWYKGSIFVPKLRRKINLQNWIMAVFVTLCAWVVAGLAFALTAHVFSGQVSTINMIAANAIAFGASILAVFAPGGLGVRETIFTYFSVALGAIVLWRLITMAVDGVVGVVAAVMIRKQTKATRRT